MIGIPSAVAIEFAVLGGRFWSLSFLSKNTIDMISAVWTSASVPCGNSSVAAATAAAFLGAALVAEFFLVFGAPPPETSLRFLVAMVVTWLRGVGSGKKEFYPDARAGSTTFG